MTVLLPAATDLLREHEAAELLRDQLAGGHSAGTVTAVQRQVLLERTPRLRDRIDALNQRIKSARARSASTEEGRRGEVPAHFREIRQRDRLFGAIDQRIARTLGELQPEIERLLQGHSLRRWLQKIQSAAQEVGSPLVRRHSNGLQIPDQEGGGFFLKAGDLGRWLEDQGYRVRFVDPAAPETASDMPTETERRAPSPFRDQTSREDALREPEQPTSNRAGVGGMLGNDVALVFGLLADRIPPSYGVRTQQQWLDAISKNMPAWLHQHRLAAGQRGKRQSTFDALGLAVALVEGRAGNVGRVPRKAMNQLFQNRKELAPWQAEWDRYYAQVKEFGD